jgi:dihydroorotate dehydrogenase
MNVFHKFLFTLPPETAHTVALQALKCAYRLGLLSSKQIDANPIQVMGLTFPNRVGLAAGFDKSAEFIDPLAALGFGFIEVGTITPKPQAGNPKPRLFRIEEQQAIINRMGFNNKGAEHAVTLLQKTKYRGVLGINIGKNRDTAIEHAIDDYLYCFKLLWPYASYITINISSPNTPGLRDLQHTDLLIALLSALKEAQQLILDKHQKYVPLVVKISPDLTEEDIQQMAQIFLDKNMDGVIATNTTLSRDGVEQARYAKEAGGLSGSPLHKQSTNCIAKLHAVLQNTIPIIASGGVIDETCVQEKLAAGAKLIQIYTGLIYAGPQLINRIAK